MLEAKPPLLPQENGMSSFGELKDLVEQFAYGRVGAQIYAIKKGPTIVSETRHPGEDFSQFNQQDQTSKQVIGVILPTENINTHIILGIDGSVVLMKKPEGNDETTKKIYDRLTSKLYEGTEIRPDRLKDKDMEIAMQAMLSCNGIYITDNGQDPETILKELNSAITKAKEENMLRQRNIQSSVPKIVDELKRYSKSVDPPENPSSI